MKKFLILIFIVVLEQSLAQSNIPNVDLISYQNEELPNENRFLMIEQTINNNFAGAGIGNSNLALIRPMEIDDTTISVFATRRICIIFLMA